MSRGEDLAIDEVEHDLCSMEVGGGGGVGGGGVDPTTRHKVNLLPPPCHHIYTAQGWVAFTHHLLHSYLLINPRHSYLTTIIFTSYLPNIIVAVTYHRICRHLPYQSFS